MSRRRSATLQFNAIQLVGGLLPASLIEQIALQQAPQQKASDYGLQKNQRLQVAVDQAWNRAKALWQEAQELRRRGEAMPWAAWFSEQLLEQVFGWADLGSCPHRQIAEAIFPITHQAFSGEVPLVFTSLGNDELDKGHRQFGQDGRRRSPHSCLQECLNADDNSNWGLLCNGASLRLLHDNPALVKPAYVAVALDQIFDGGLFDEFAVVWLLLHASRFQRRDDSSCALDGWKQEGQQSGERALNKLRDGVQAALEAVGQGVLQHPANGDLVAKLQNGELSTQTFFRQLLRLVYRLLFLCVAEDRNLLFAPEVPLELRQIYREGYSLSRLRDLAIRSGAHEQLHGDLWLVQKLVFEQLRNPEGSSLGLPALGGLFEEDRCSDLDTAQLSNAALLEAVRAIGWFYDEQSQSRTRINYQALNTEEFGSVYESLLELHPQVRSVGGGLRFSLGGVAGSERKTSGSYYTPDDLVRLLILSALLPVIRDRVSKATTPEEKEKALLAIRVLDPACGSGHFLLAAARRLALELARIKAGDDEPSEELRRECLRKVVARCIYGVDKNPMAVELCKVALWIEAIEPGKPLGFLDAHIHYGDSLAGIFDPKVLDEGVPDGAYKALPGDDKKICARLKKKNQAFVLKGQGDLFTAAGIRMLIPSATSFEDIEEDNLQAVHIKEQAYRAWRNDPTIQQELQRADAYTAAFFLSKNQDTEAIVPSSQNLDQLKRGSSLPAAMASAVAEAANDFCFLHWHLAFPGVMSQGGFDCLLGNPPWEVSQINESEWFNSRSEEIASAKGARRKTLIKELESSGSPLFSQFEREKAGLKSLNAFCRESRFRLSTTGKLNLYSLFLELSIMARKPDGRVGIILPSGALYDKGNADLIKSMIRDRILISSVGFDNSEKIFPAVHPDTPFSLLTLGMGGDTFSAWAYILQVASLSDSERCVVMEGDQMPMFSPNTWSVPLPRSRCDFALLGKIYQNGQILFEQNKSSEWIRGIRQGLYNMSTASSQFVSASIASDDPSMVRVYEAKYFHCFNPRWATYDLSSGHVVDNNEESLRLEDNIICQHYVTRDDVEMKLKELNWHHSYLIAWRDITNATNERTAIFALLPRAGLGNNAGLLIPREDLHPSDILVLLANLNSLVFDYATRQKVGGTHLNGFILGQLPVLERGKIDRDDIDFLSERAGRLSFNSADLEDAALEFGLRPQATLASERCVLKAEIDAYIARLYGLTHDELRYILDPSDVMGPDYPSETFRVLKNSEIRQFGEYRTQRLVLEAWDRLFGP